MKKSPGSLNKTTLMIGAEQILQIVVARTTDLDNLRTNRENQPRTVSQAQPLLSIALL
jgi:hypothetical protein